jgi:putative tricarboxylic transport membrane protein
MRAPEGAIEFTVGAGAGGSPDVIMRTIAQIMTEEGIVENPIVVQNRSGAGHSNAYNHVLSLPGDENTLLTMASPVFTTPIVQGTPSVVDQVTPIAGFIQSELVLLTTPDSPFNSLADMVAAAKAEPGRVRVAGGASGGNDHIARKASTAGQRGSSYAISNSRPCLWDRRSNPTDRWRVRSSIRLWASEQVVTCSDQSPW